MNKIFWVDEIKKIDNLLTLHIFVFNTDYNNFFFFIYFYWNYFITLQFPMSNRRGENDEDIAFLNEKNPALQDVVRRLPPILTDYKIKSADLVVNQTHVKVKSNQLKCYVSFKYLI